MAAIDRLLAPCGHRYLDATDAQGLRSYFTTACVGRISHQLLHVLDFLHGLGLKHCDVKPENVCICSASRGEVKLIDFGSSLLTYDTTNSYVQSRWYRAPEVVLGLPWDSKVDLWSLGCLLCELLVGQPIFYGASVAATLAAQQVLLAICSRRLRAATPERHPSATGVSAARHPSATRLPSQAVLGPHPAALLDTANRDLRRMYFGPGGGLYVVSPAGRPEGVYELRPVRKPLAEVLEVDDPELVDFLSTLLTYDPVQRPSAAQALQHPWMLKQSQQCALSPRAGETSLASRRLPKAPAADPSPSHSPVAAMSAGTASERTPRRRVAAAVSAPSTTSLAGCVIVLDCA